MSIKKPKIVSIVPVWNEQQMIALSIASTKDIVYQYIILIKKGTYDKTLEVLNVIKEKWNLNMIIIESDLKLRERRKYAVEISKDYADYYLIQDGDEIYFNNSGLNNDTKTILKLINEGYTFCLTSIIFLEKDFLHTPKDENQIWLTPHPFLFKNTPDIYWPDVGDMPSYNPNNSYHKIYNTGERNNPFKFDCKIKDYKRVFLREMFTPWHDSDFNGTIEEYADKYHYTVLWYRENVDKNLTLDEIIKRDEEYVNSNDTNKYKWHKIYDEHLYFKYPIIIKKCIKLGLIEGIKSIDYLKYLDSI
jgi:hypothetical protein